MKRVAMVVFSYYPQDPRVRREAEALSEAGISVDIICLVYNNEPGQERINGVNVHRFKFNRQRAGKFRYLFEYSRFILTAFLKLARLHLTRRFNVVHVHNMPDILVASALVPKLTGAKIILDLHDPMPELFMTKFSIYASHPVVRMINFFEKLSIKLADLVFTPNISFRDLFISRGCPPDKIHIIMNSPMESIFDRQKASANEVNSSKSEKFVLMYHGAIEERYGLDTAIKAVNHLKDEIPNLAMEIYGRGSFEKRSKKLVDDLHLGNVVRFHGIVPLENIASAIMTADVGLIPNKMNAFTNINFPTRIFEYLAMGKPVIAPHTQGIKDYFDEESIHYFTPGDANSLAKKILSIYSNPAITERIVQRGVKIYEQHRWMFQRKNLVNLVCGLMEGGVSGSDTKNRTA
jgi:glycosyltransferase involved in cell wall biosynthesis